MSPHPEILDWQEAVERLQGREDMLKSLAQAFATESAALMAEIGDAMARDDTAKLHRAAHTLKGSADIFSAKATVGAAQRLERIAHSGNLDDARQAWSDLQHEMRRLMPALAEHAGKGSE